MHTASNNEWTNPDYWEELKTRFSQINPVIILESQIGEGDSYIAAFPAQIFSSDGLEKAQSLQKLKEVLDKEEWLFGFVSYELKNSFENLQSLNDKYADLPDWWFMIPNLLIKKTAGKPVLEWIKGHSGMIPKKRSISERVKYGGVTNNDTQEEYLKKIEQIQAEISDGLYYEINLSRLITASFSGDSYRLYQAMQFVNPVPMAAFIRTEKWSVCSASPEIFIQKNGTVLRSFPIKGTSRRGANPEEDNVLKMELQQSQKERAENLMIVDVVRNDFSRISKPGNVKAEALFKIKSYQTVHQMESEISAELDRNVSLFTIFKATFPMASMTGAPKIASMEAIDRLENYSRGLYSGAIGFKNPANDALFNVVIRTAILQNNQLFYGVGGAITADSNPVSEWNETEIKTQTLIEALQWLNKEFL